MAGWKDQLNLLCLVYDPFKHSIIVTERNDKMEKDKLDIEKILKQPLKNIVIERNKPNIELFAKSFYDVYMRP
jgi:hypothetical protein